MQRDGRDLGTAFLGLRRCEENPSFLVLSLYMFSSIIIIIILCPSECLLSAHIQRCLATPVILKPQHHNVDVWSWASAALLMWGGHFFAAGVGVLPQKMLKILD